MKRTAFAAIAILILSAAAALGTPVQRVRAIQSPLFNIPAIVKAGDSFKLEIETGGKLTLTGASLEVVNNPAKRFPLKLKQVSSEGTRAVYSATVPATAPEALFDLAAQFSDSSSEYDRTDQQPHAVKVVKKFKTEYDIIQITDIHFNVQDVKGQDFNRLRRWFLKEVSRRNPEFVIFTGDLGLEPPTYDWDYIYGYEQFSQNLTVPVFMVPGNHEMYYDKTPERTIDGAEYWKATYGPMYHSFDYGKTHFIGIADYECWEPKWRTRKSPDAMFHATVLNACISDKEWSWIQDDLKASSARGQSCVAYAHIPIETLQGGRKIGMPPFIGPGPNTDQFVKVLTDSGCTHIFVGHNHYNKEFKFGKLTEFLTIGSGTASNSKKDYGTQGFSIIHIKDGKVTGTKTVEMSLKDMK